VTSEPNAVAVDDETPSPAPDGEAVYFRTAAPYRAGSLAVRVDCIPVPPGEVLELGWADRLFALSRAPRADQVVRVDYDRG
jgi:hypothetical protein